MPQLQLYHWVAFGVLVVVLLVLDLCVFHRHAHEPTLRESLGWSIFWVALGLAFNGLVYFWLGANAGLAFLQGYVVEKSLSVDNIFVFVVIFRFFAVPLKYQYRVLFWGILGAIIMRLAFVAGAVAIVQHFNWVLWVFGAFLVYTGVRLAFHGDADIHPEKNILMRTARRVFPITDTLRGDKFFSREGGRLCATPLFLVLLVVESTDVIFAVDSVPAIIGVVKKWMQPGSAFLFVAFTSNVFAILGLRALYFLLAGVIGMFRYLSYGLSVVLVFVGLEMIADYWAPRLLGVEEASHFHLLPGWVSMLIIFATLALSILASVLADPKKNAQP